MFLLCYIADFLTGLIYVHPAVCSLSDSLFLFVTITLLLWTVCPCLLREYANNRRLQNICADLKDMFCILNFIIQHDSAKQTKKSVKYAILSISNI